MIILYMILMFYSLLCGPDIFFRLINNRFSESPEFAFFYFISCIVLGVTLIGLVLRVVYAVHDHYRSAK